MIGFLKKSHTVLKDTRKIEKTYETDLLGDSLETVLSKKSGQRVFRHFLKTEFCEENLDFWLACKEYQMCDSQERRTQMAARIYDEFISNNSPKQVNLDFHTKETIRQSLEKPSLSCFRVAEKKIYILMENCSFPRFIETEPYKIFINSISKQTGIKRNRVAVRIKSPVQDFKVNPLLLVSKD